MKFTLKQRRENAEIGCKIIDLMPFEQDRALEIVAVTLRGILEAYDGDEKPARVEYVKKRLGI